MIATGIDVWMQFREDAKENKRLQQIKASKNQFVSAYQVEINKVIDQFKNYLSNVFDNYNNKLDEVNRSKTELIEASKRNDLTIKKIDDLDAEYADFIEIIGAEQ